MLAIIPARSGSKGLSGKNIKLLNNKPLIAYTIEAAKKSKLVSEIFVSTDSEKIQKVAIDFGANCPTLRPKELSADNSLSIDVYKHVIKKLNETRDKKIDNFIVLQPTSPLRTDKNIDEAIELFIDKKADSVISFTPEKHPIYWHKFINDENKFVDIFDDIPKNRQNYRKSYYPNGSIYVFKTEIINKGIYTTNNSFPYIMKNEKSVDIDTLQDFEYAEFLLQKMIAKNSI